MEVGWPVVIIDMSEVVVKDVGEVVVVVETMWVRWWQHRHLHHDKMG